QGRRDVPRGGAQAAHNGRALAALGGGAAALDYVASPLGARETMEIVRDELGLPRRAYRLDQRLAEIHYGHWEGQLWAELPRSDPEGFAAAPGGHLELAAARRRGLLRAVGARRHGACRGQTRQCGRRPRRRHARAALLGRAPRTRTNAAPPVPQDRVLCLIGAASAWLCP